MSWAKRYLPVFIVKTFPEFFLEKSMDLYALQLKSIQQKLRRKTNREKYLRHFFKSLTGQ